MCQFMFHLDGDNLKQFVTTIAEFTNEIIPPEFSVITLERFNSNGIVYTHLFNWEESLGPNLIFESENSVSNGDFVISSKTDLFAFMQESQYIMRIEPFDYVGLMAEDAVPYLPNLVKPGETVVMLPAFLFHWLLNQKEHEQVLKDFSSTIDLGLSLATLGVYSTGKIITKVSLKTTEGMIIDFGIQAFINTLDGTSIQDAVNQVDWKNVIWAGASANIDDSKIGLALGCLRGGSRGFLNNGNGSVREAIASAGAECFLDVVLTMVSKGLVREGDRYFEPIKKKLEVSPEFVTKRLLKYGLNKAFLTQVKETIVKAETRNQIDTAIVEYEEEK